MTLTDKEKLEASAGWKILEHIRILTAVPSNVDFTSQIQLIHKMKEVLDMEYITYIDRSSKYLDCA